MKRLAISILVGATLFSLMSFAQSVGGGGSNGGGSSRGSMSRNSNPIVARKGGCIEGNRTLFYERDYANDTSVAVYRTCQNGSYYDLSDYIYNPKSRCTEGRRELWQERDNVNDRHVYKRVVCTGNKWKVVDTFY